MKETFTRQRVKQNRKQINTFTGVNQSITPGIVHNGTVTSIRLILMTFEIFQSCSYKISI